MKIKSKSSNKVYLSVDFEDFNYDLKRKLGLKPNNKNNMKALWQSYEIINNFLESNHGGAKITFFCTGVLANKYPNLIKKISNDGHEIACHYNFHDSVRDEDLKEFEKNIVLAITALEKQSNNKVTGFRAPYFSLEATDVNHFKILSKYFKYDASLTSNNPLEIEKLEQLINSNKFKLIPVVAERPYLVFPYMKSGGTYLKLFHTHFAEKVISKNLIKNKVAQIYLHPYEVVSDMSFYLTWKELNGLSFYKKLFWLIRQCQWHIIGNKSLMRKLKNIFLKYEIGGKMNSI